MKITVQNNSEQRLYSVLLGGDYVDQVGDHHEFLTNYVFKEWLKPGKSGSEKFGTDVPINWSFGVPRLKVLKVTYFKATPCVEETK